MKGWRENLRVLSTGKRNSERGNMEGEANTSVIEGGLERLVGQRRLPLSCV